MEIRLYFNINVSATQWLPRQSNMYGRPMTFLSETVKAITVFAAVRFILSAGTCNAVSSYQKHLN